MFEHLTKFKRIYVNGPPRSGTTICSRMIAQDTNYKLLDETVYSHYINKSKLDKTLNEENFVAQCPQESYCIEEYANDTTLIVFMIRPIEEIIRSQKRVNWSHEQVELLKYGFTPVSNLKDNPKISEVKYNYWNEQKKSIKNFLEVHYRSLSSHRLWVEDNLRNNFTIKQTSLSNPITQFYSQKKWFL